MKISHSYRGTNELKSSYQLKSNFLMEENSDVLEDSQNILKR
jgi:hypothetical protein